MLFTLFGGIYFICVAIAAFGLYKTPEVLMGVFAALAAIGLFVDGYRARKI